MERRQLSWQRGYQLHEDAHRYRGNGAGAMAALRKAALNLLRLDGYQLIGTGIQAVMHDITALLAMVKQQPKHNPFLKFESAMVSTALIHLATGVDHVVSGLRAIDLVFSVGVVQPLICQCRDDLAGQQSGVMGLVAGERDSLSLLFTESVGNQTGLPLRRSCLPPSPRQAFHQRLRVRREIPI